MIAASSPGQRSGAAAVPAAVGAGTGLILGRVVSLHRYPVKSMRAETLEAAELHWTGLAGDRQYAFVRAADSSSFPWLTGRQVPSLVLHRACYAGDDPRGAVRVTRPDGAELAVEDPALAAGLAEAAEEPVRLMRLSRGAYDAMPVSVLTAAEAALVEQAHGTARRWGWRASGPTS